MKIKNNLFYLLDDYRSNNIFFFAGSGISYDSFLPSAYSILQATIETFLPNNLDLENKEKLLNIQPEVFYEILLKVSQNNLEVLDIWKVLYSQVNTTSKPNLNHFFIVQYSYLARTPIFTTNFDSMFEEMAKELDIPYVVYLPHDQPPEDCSKHLAICKLHGSIEDGKGNFTPHNIFTTMTTITKLNSKWILFLTNLLKEKSITFVGYSGRDIDIFPYIEKSVEKSKNMYWINRFDMDEYSKKYANKIKAIKLNFFPKTLFRCSLRKKNLVTKLNLTKQSEVNHNSLIEDIQKLLHTKKILDEYEKEVLYLILLKSLGNYSESYTLSLNFYNHKLFNLSTEIQLIFLEHFTQLNHEVSKYNTYRKLAKELVRKAFFQKNINFYLMGRFFISESYRMNIPNDFYFPYKRSIKEYFFILFTLVSFFTTYMVAKILSFFFAKQLEDNTYFELIEHKIRFFALLQGSLGNPTKGWNKYIMKFFNKIWSNIKTESYSYGYVSGIANSGKFKQRLEENITNNDFEESNNIYNLLNSSTGKELNLRNKADKLFQQGKIEEAYGYYQSFLKQSQISGNRLNEIKGLMAIAFMNAKEKKKKLLSDIEKERFFFLSQEIEGFFWKKYFKKIYLRILK